MVSQPFTNPLVVALDVDTRDEALKLADALAGLAGGLKIGPRLGLRYGASFVQEIAARAPVFMDNKHFDIPSTMEAAVRASFAAGASVVTVHALSGHEALKRMAEVELELNRQRPFRVLAVTILTSWDESSLPPVMTRQPVEKHVDELADLAGTSGISSLVCSPHELDRLRGRGFYLLTPGIRFDAVAGEDQKRVMTARQAVDKGACALVVGRPVIQAADPRATARKFLDSIQ